VPAICQSVGHDSIMFRSFVSGSGIYFGIYEMSIFFVNSWGTDAILGYA
jgi:hypothetical protein